MGTVYLKERNFQKAEQHLRESIDFNPKIAFTYLNLGAVYSIQKKYEAGITMFTRSLELSPNEIRALFGLAKIHSIRGEPDKANQFFSRVIELDSKGRLANHAKRAMASLPSLEDKSAGSTDAASAGIEQLYQQGYRAYLSTDYDRSIQMYRDYLSTREDDDFVWFSLGEAYLRTGEISKAVECYQNAAKLGPKALYYKELAIAYNYLNRESDVIDCLKKAKSLGKNDSLTDTLWGKILLTQKNYEEAVANLEQAIRKNANNLLAKFYLAVAYNKMNRTKSARNYLEDILLSPITSPLKKEAETLLQKLK